eukprot:g10966.t1
MRAASSSKSVVVSDAILAARNAFDGGEFQPAAFPRCACLLLDAFEGGDNAIRLCAARLLERFRPYFGGSILAVEVVQRVSLLLGHHDDPTTRELCLDVLAAVAHGAGGLPRRSLVDVGRSLRSPFLPERQAAARAYASCMCVHRSSQRSSSSSLQLLTPRTLEDMAALSSALLPKLSWGRDGGGGGGGDGGGSGDARVSSLVPVKGIETVEGVAVAAWRGGSDGGGSIEYGSRADGAEGLLEAVLWKVTGDLPSTELWESLKVFLLDDGKAFPSSCSSRELNKEPNITALVDLLLYRLRSSCGRGTGNPALRAIAVDFFVALIQVEAVERSKFARAAAQAAVEAAAAADAASAAAAAGNCTADTTVTSPAKKAAPKAPSVAAAPTPGRSAVWRLLGALSASETDPEKTELLSVLGAPALAVAVVETEAVAGAKSAAKMAAAHGFGEGGGSSGAGGVSDAHVKARTRFPLATAAVEKFRQLCSSNPSASSSSSPSSSALMLACTSSLVSFSIAAFRETPHYPASDSISGGAARRDKAMSALAEFATDGVLSSPSVVGLLSAGGGGPRGGGGGNIMAAAGVRSLLLPQLRALASVHAWPRRRVVVAVVRSLAEAAPGSPLAVDLAVLASQVVRAGEQDSLGAGAEEVDEAEKLLWELLFGRRFFTQNPKAAVGVAVALMRYHRGTLGRQSTLSAALVGAMGCGGGAGGGGGDRTVHGDNDDAGAAFSFTTPAGGGGGQSGADGKKGAPGGSDGEVKQSVEGEASPEGSDPIVRDPWFQLVLCRECMLHGFYEAAEAGLRRLRQAGGAGARGAAAAAPTSDAVWVWTEVLGKVSAAETFFGGLSDPVAAHACAAHETALAAELLPSLPRRGLPGTGRRSPQPQPSTVWPTGVEASGYGIAAVFVSGGSGGGLFAFQRSFLEARAELLRLLGACWGICQDLSATRTNRYARFSRREARCRRLPAAFRKLARDFRLLRGLAPGAGPTTTEPLRAASCLCLFLAIAADALLSQGKSVLAGSREKNMTKKSWRAWLERLVACGPGAGVGQEEEADGADGGAGQGNEGAMMKAVRVLGARLLGLSDPPKAPIGRVAFSSILESVRGTPFPMPRAFFRTGVTPRVALSVLPPAPPALTTSSTAMIIGPDEGMFVDGSSSNNVNSAWSGGNLPSPQQQHRRQMSDESTSAPSSAPGGGSTAGTDEASGGGGGLTVGEKRQRRDGGIGAKYYGPSCRLRTDMAEAERARRPRLPLMSAPAGAPSPTAAAKNRKSSRSDVASRIRDLSSSSFSASEVWWAQTAREETMFAVSGGMGGVGGGGGGGGGGGNCGWRSHALAQMGSPGVWLLQGTVCRGRGAGGALPSVSEVVLKVSVGLPAGAENGGAEGTLKATRESLWSTQVVAQTFGAAADSSTALCFRAQVHMPSLVVTAAPNAAAAAAAAATAGGGVMEVAVSLRSRGKQQQHEERATTTGFAALGGDCGSGSNHGVGAGSGEEEVWVVGTIHVPLPPSLPPPGRW